MNSQAQLRKPKACGYRNYFWIAGTCSLFQSGDGPPQSKRDLKVAPTNPIIKTGGLPFFFILKPKPQAFGLRFGLQSESRGFAPAPQKGKSVKT